MASVLAEETHFIDICAKNIHVTGMMQLVDFGQILCSSWRANVNKSVNKVVP